MRVYFPNQKIFGPTVTPPVLPNQRTDTKPADISKLDFPLIPKDLFEGDEQRLVEAMYTRDHNIDSSVIRVQSPGEESSNFLESRFFSIKDTQVCFWGETFNLDIYFTPDPRDTELMHELLIHKQMEQGRATLKFARDLERITYEIKGNTTKDDVLYALSFFKHVAREGKKIVYIDAHGDTDRSTGKWIAVRPGKPPVYIENILQAIHKIYSHEDIGVIYLGCCNPGNLQIDLSKVASEQNKIPVIFHTKNNELDRADVRLLLPD